MVAFSDPLYNERDDLYFDPDTYLMTGESDVNATTGQIEDSQAIVESQVVDRIPVTPGG